MKSVTVTQFMLNKWAEGQPVTIAAAGLLLVPSAEIKKRPSVPVAADAPLCLTCGMMMVPNGSCYKCENCGGTSGCG